MQVYMRGKVMSNTKFLLTIYILITTVTCSYAFIIDSEFNTQPHADSVYNYWAHAGCASLTQTIREIDITNIPPIVSWNPNTNDYDTTTFISAIPNDDSDDHDSFQILIDFIQLRELNLTEHIRILLPVGVYNFSDQLVLRSNISLKGEGSSSTILDF